MSKDYTMYHKLTYENSEKYSRNFLLLNYSTEQPSNYYIPSSFGGAVGP